MFIYKEHMSLYSWFQALFSMLHPSEIIIKHLFKSNSIPPFGFFILIVLLFPWMLATLPPMMLHTSQSNSDSATARVSPQNPSSQWRQVHLFEMKVAVISVIWFRKKCAVAYNIFKYLSSMESQCRILQIKQ